MGARECLRREISWWPLVSYKFLVFFFNQVARLVDPSSSSRDPTRALRVKVLSPNHWTAREFPTIHVTILFLVFICMSIYQFQSFIWLLWVLVAAYRISAASRGIFACSKDGPSPAVVRGLSGGGVQA